MIPIGNERPERHPAVITWAIVVSCVAVFIHELCLSPTDLELFVTRWGLVPARFGQGFGTSAEALLWSTLGQCVSSMFLHGGWLHIIGNLWSLLIFGRGIEARMGSFRFLVFYMTCGVLAGFAHTLLSWGSSVPTIGASGAIAGVMGAYFLLCPFEWLRVIVPFFFIPVVIKVPAVLYLLLWIISQFAGAYQTIGTGAGAGGIAFSAHIGGFAAGVYLIIRWKRHRSHRRRS